MDEPDRRKSATQYSGGRCNQLQQKEDPGLAQGEPPEEEGGLALPLALQAAISWTILCVAFLILMLMQTFATKQGP